MRHLISKLLIVCILAISLHGFGTNEHSALASEAEDILQFSSFDLDDSEENLPPTLNVACDICQVVHQYMIVDAITGLAPRPITKIAQTAVSPPPDHGVRDILHPPTY